MRRSPAPWAELEFDNIIFTVPSDTVRSLERPEEVAARWNHIMRAIADLAVIPHKYPRKERFVADVQISHGELLFVVVLSYSIVSLFLVFKMLKGWAIWQKIESRFYFPY